MASDNLRDRIAAASRSASVIRHLRWTLNPGSAEDAKRIPSGSYRPTLHDAITFAIRDNFSPRMWAEADDIAVVVIGAVSRYRRSVSEDDFLDSLLAWDDDSLGD